MVFAGVVSTIVDLEKIPGLVPAADIDYELHPKVRQQRQLTEVVLSSQLAADWQHGARRQLSVNATTPLWWRSIATVFA